MKSQNRVFYIFVLVAFTLITGCASHQPHIDVAIVTQKLQSYQVGKTTYADFVRDTGLIINERPLLAASAQPSWAPKTHEVWELPAGSAWKVYEIDHNMSYANYKFSQTNKFVVGDINHAISILTFDGNGDLMGISPAQ